MSRLISGSRVFLAASVLLLGSGPARAAEIAPSALQQIQALIDEKESRTPAQRKIDSNLLQAFREKHGKPMARGVTTLERADVGMDSAGFVDVDIKGIPSADLQGSIEKVGGRVIFSSAKYQSVTAHVPLDQIETLAAHRDIRMIYPKALAETQRARQWELAETPGEPPVRLPFATRAENVRDQLRDALRKIAAANGSAPLVHLTPLVGTKQSEGDATHAANTARSTYGYDGTGIRIGVISDSVDHLGESQVNGNLGTVTVLPGMSGVPGTGEGTAMLEIVHDLAPGAQLFFATAFISEASFASNITALRGAPYNCDIIVDDVGYFDEPVFEDGIVAQAVNGVVTGGGMYFSSAANSGNLTDSTAGTWEGDFVDGGASAAPLPLTGNVHQFSVGNLNDQLSVAGRPYLFWSDKFGASANDYDLFVLNSTATSVLASSTNTQSGTQDPLEFTASQAVGRRIVILKKTGAANRFLHLDTNRGTLAIRTAGQTHGHGSAAGAFSVAATPAAVQFGAPTPAGPYPGLFTGANQVENFSSDGTRRMFYDPTGTPYTPADFSSTGGAVRQKPDFTAADGVSTSVAGFGTFYGTSAAAPHAAAIAALLKQVGRTPAQIRTDLTSTAIDIMTAGTDRDAGAGIIMAKAALDSIAPAAVSNAFISAYTPAEGSGNNGNGFIEPGENADLTVTIKNGGGATATSVTGTLSLATPLAGVTITNPGPVTFGSGTILAGATADNSANKFSIHIDSSVACPQQIDFVVTVTYGNGAAGASPTQLGLSILAGRNVVINSTLDPTAPTSTADYTASGGQQTGRLNRNGITTSCGVVKVTPGLQDSTPGRRYDAYTFTNAAPGTICVTATLATACNASTPGTVYLVAYGNAGFVPATITSNYAADYGITTGGDATIAFNVATGQAYTIVVHEITPGATDSAACSYTLTVSGGAFCQAATPVQLLGFGAE